MALRLSMTSLHCIYLLGLIVHLVGSQGAGEGSETSAPTTGQSGSVDSIPAANSQKFHISLHTDLGPTTVYERKKLTLDCEIVGKPTPIYEWSKDGVELSSSRRYSIRTTDWGSRLKITNMTLLDSGVYQCIGRSSAGTRNTSSVVTVLKAERTVTTTPIAIRPPVTNRVEADFKKPVCQVYEKGYCGFLRSKEVYATSRYTQDNAQQNVVAMVEQLQQMNIDVNSKCFEKSVEAACYKNLPLCSKRPGGLLAVARRLCKQECMELYNICYSLFPKDDHSKWDLLPSCQDLDNSAGCVRIGLFKDQEMTTTKSLNKGNFEEQETQALTAMLLSVALPVVLAALLVIVIIVVAVCICKRRSKMNRGNSVPSSNSSHGKSVELSSLSDRGAGPAYVKEVSLDNVNMLQELGESSFGKVYHGQVFGLYGNNTASTVFIKCLREKASSEEVAEFREEVSSMSEIRHQHIVSLLAMSTKGITQCVLYEHLQLGDLRQFILSQQSRGNALTCKETMYIVTQVASALEYLSSLHYVHKDIAAHNVIVSHNLNVKLSNLKIVNGVHSANYCSIHNKMLPIRWLPAESITYNRFGTDTDIYSYGVLLWEAFSGATQPYVGFTNPEVIEMIRSRQLLACPNSCPPRIYSLMMECWHETASKRPVAKDVHQKMRAWYLDNSYAISTTTGPSISHSGSTCTAPSQHSSVGLPANNLNVNSNHNNLIDVQGSRHAVDEMGMKPGYMHSNSVGGQEDVAPYYSTIDSSYAPGPHTVSSSSFDNASEYTASTNPPPQQSLVNNAMPPNFYASTPTHRYASLNRRHNDSDFGTQTTPLFQQTDQV